MNKTKDKNIQRKIDETIKILDYIREGKQGSFPHLYFVEDIEIGKECFKACFHYHIKKEHKVRRGSEHHYVRRCIIHEMKMSNAFKDLYDGKMDLLFFDLFPEKHIWDMSMIPKHTWTKETEYEFTKWYIEDYLKLDESNVYEMDTEYCLNGCEYSKVVRKAGGVSNMIVRLYPHLDLIEVRRELKSRMTTKTMARFYHGKEV